MTEKDTSFVIFIAFFIGLVFGLISGFFSGKTNGINCMKSEAIIAKVAKYEGNLETGEAEFRWIAECTK